MSTLLLGFSYRLWQARHASAARLWTTQLREKHLRATLNLLLLLLLLLLLHDTSHCNLHFMLRHMHMHACRPRFLALDTGSGKRAMQALLGFGYLLTVLHEKHLGGHIEFTLHMDSAAATAAA
jgi:hypothetical protein